MLALSFGVASTALGADGKPLLLGNSNAATKASTLVKSGAGPALDLGVGSGAPLKVNSQAKVANLNADQVDGMSANGVVRVAPASADEALVGGSGEILSTPIVAPSRGFLVMNASTDVAASGDDLVVCSLEIDGEDIASTDRGSERRTSRDRPNKRPVRRTGPSRSRRAGTPSISKRSCVREREPDPPRIA